MKDPFDPSDAELLAWAFEPDALAPEQDWDLIIASLSRADLFLRLAADPSCPQRDFFRQVLDGMVRDCFRTDGQAYGFDDIVSLLQRAAGSSDGELAAWGRRQLEHAATLEARGDESAAKLARTVAEAERRWLPEIVSRGKERDFYLACLARLGGEVGPVRARVPAFEKLVAKAQESGDPELVEWARRSS